MKKIRISLLILLLVSCVMTACSNEESKPEEAENVEISYENEIVEPVLIEQAEMPQTAIWQDMLISLEGVLIDLKTDTVGILLDSGWEILDEDFTAVVGSNGVELYYEGEEEKEIYIEFEKADSEMEIRDCLLKYISIECDVNFGLAGGITQDSTQEEIALKLGRPVLNNKNAMERPNAIPQSETWFYTDDYQYRYLRIAFCSGGYDIILATFDDYESYYERLSLLLEYLDTVGLSNANKIKNADEYYPDYEWGEMKADYGVERLSERETRQVENFTVLHDINSGLVLYLPNEDWTKLECISWGGELSTSRVVEELKNRGVLPDNVNCNEYYTSRFRGLVLDENFCTYLDSLSKEREEMTLASLVFSIGANWGAREMYLDSNYNGTALMTKHCLYDVPVSPEAFYYLFD